MKFKRKKRYLQYSNIYNVTFYHGKVLVSPLTAMFQQLFKSFLKKRPEFTLEKMGFDSTRKKNKTSCIPSYVVQRSDKLISHLEDMNNVIVSEVCKSINW